MIEPERGQFALILAKSLAVFDKKIDKDGIEAWFRALKAHPLIDVQDALDTHVRNGRFAPRPGDITRRIVGDNGRGDAMEAAGKQQPQQCSFESNGDRCPMTATPASGTANLCRWHDESRGDPAHGQRLLEDFQSRGTPFEPQTPNRQLAEFLFETQGRHAVSHQLGAHYAHWCQQEKKAGRLVECRYTTEELRAEHQHRNPIQQAA